MISIEKSDSKPIYNQSDIVGVRQTVRDWAIAQKFSIVDQTKIVTAASELARNTLIYGMGGVMKIEALANGASKGLRLIFEDKGPGIVDMQKAMTDGYTTGGGLGMGLTGSKRLVNEFDIQSEVGKGTTVTIVKWK